MKTHIPVAEGGISICIHSICVDKAWRRQGVATGLLKEFVGRCEKEARDERLKAVLLLCHEELIGLYQKAGFELVGKSSVAHGSRSWFEMKRGLDQTPSSGGSADLSLGSAQADILSALYKASSPTGPTAQSFASFATVHDLVSADASTGSQRNKFNLVCPREGCRSLILLKGVAQMVEAASVSVSRRHLHSQPQFWCLSTHNCVDIAARLTLRSSTDIPPASPSRTANHDGMVACLA